MKIAVVVPWQGPDPARAAAWAWVRARYEAEHPTWPVVEGVLPEGTPWCKARAVAAALDHTDAEVLVIADADSWSDGTGEAVRLVAGGHAAWAVPHWHVRRLNPDATARVLAGATPSGKLDLERPAYVGYAGGGITVIRREVYERTPLDARYLGWGGEDMSWGLALSTLEGEGWRGQADLWHLHHGAPPRTDVYGSQPVKDLHRCYQMARNRPGLMRALVDEGKAPAI